MEFTNSSGLTQFGTKRAAAKLLGLSPETLKKYRLHDKTLVEGIHWIKLNSRTIRYNLPLLADWLQNRHNPAAHQKAIEQYLSALWPVTNPSGGDQSPLSSVPNHT
jgi:hypothetical protein